jgi:hypothetical protein
MLTPMALGPTRQITVDKVLAGLTQLGGDFLALT